VQRHWDKARIYLHRTIRHATLPWTSPHADDPGQGRGRDLRQAGEGGEEKV